MLLFCQPVHSSFVGYYVRVHRKNKPDTRPSVADGWAGADMRVFPLFDSMVTDGRTDGQSLL